MQLRDAMLSSSPAGGLWKFVNATAREVCHVTLATGSGDQSEVSWSKTSAYVRFWHPLIWNVSLGAGAGRIGRFWFVYVTMRSPRVH